MRLNEATAISTPKLILVPYSEHHVPEYHKWMQDEELQKLTASEPLTMKEEYEMQRSWRTSTDKLTFIACENESKETEKGAVQISAGVDDSSRNMIGDVNLFLFEDDLEEIIGEVEIMIARRDCQGKGYGHLILSMFLWYIVRNVDAILEHFGGDDTKASLKYLRAKIDAENERSIRLFEKVGFEKIDEKPNYFGEVELRLTLSGQEELGWKGKGEPPRVAEYKLNSGELDKSLPMD
ncbi:acyl-CoA N-acyltransferase [Tothia fuscella]|uniref:Acyl-CoA N-acyltransferase n=1 Tax=Tothia fuscella TaxID=1048955 RepID=A0A9P4NQM0_9PEZI|nr:acyl-CoA N-acyltransferase [Tothia fuscella]